MLLQVVDKYALAVFATLLALITSVDFLRAAGEGRGRYREPLTLEQCREQSSRAGAAMLTIGFAAAEVTGVFL